MHSGKLEDVGLVFLVDNETVTAVDTNDEMALSCRLQIAELLTIMLDMARNTNSMAHAVTVTQETAKAMPETDEKVDGRTVYRRQTWPQTVTSAALSPQPDAMGTPENLDRAIALLDSSFPLLGLDDTNFVAGLDYAVILLGTRSEQQKSDVSNLNDAMQWCEAAIARTLAWDPDRPRKLQDLANRLAGRAEYTENASNLENGIESALDALGDATLRSGKRAKWLRDLKLEALSMRCTAKQSQLIRTDLVNGTTARSQSIYLARKGDGVVFFGFLANKFVNVLRSSYERECGNANHLNQAAGLLEEALGRLGLNPRQAFLYYGLGETLLLRYEYAIAVESAECTIQACQRTLENEAVPPTIRIRAGLRAAELLGPFGRWAEGTTALVRAVHLLHLLPLVLLQAESKQQFIRHFSGIGAAAAAAALNAGKCATDALQYLELGRAIIPGFLLDMRTDTSALKQAHPDLEQDFLRLSSTLAGFHTEYHLPQGLMTVPFNADEGHWRRPLARELKDLLIKIRSQPGFEQFLLPPTAEQLLAAAVPGPIIVVNVSEWRCDAFLVQPHNIRVVRLPNLHQEKIKQAHESVHMDSSSLETTLKWLWEALVCPVLDALDSKGRKQASGGWTRVWWVAVGPLSGLPLHAAGDHGYHGGETAMDRVMSSYSSSIKALIAGRTPQPLPPSTSTPGRMLLVSMPDTPGKKELSFADPEVAVLSELCPSMHLRAERPPSLTKRQVLSQLRGCRVFHFAGHGHTDTADPSQSCLLLKDWEIDPLTVADLRRQHLQEAALATAPFLAYLSACSTAANEKLTLADEAIHLVSACRLAGFRHVVGTLWSVSDPFCPKLARLFYQTLLDEMDRAQRVRNTRCRGEDVTNIDAAVCRALHLAQRGLRNVGIQDRHETTATHDGLGRGAIGIPSSRRDNLLWVPYVHFGV